MAAVVEQISCIACGACMGECPTGAITVEDMAIIDNDTCISCGTCVDACPVNAISME